MEALLQSTKVDPHRLREILEPEGQVSNLYVRIKENKFQI